MIAKRILAILLVLILLGAVFAVALPAIAGKKDKDKGNNNDIDDEDGDCQISPRFIKKYALEVLCEAKAKNKTLNKIIDRVIDYIERSLNIHPKNAEKSWKKFPLWVDAWHLNSQHGHMVFNEEKKAVKHMMRAICSLEALIKEIMKECESLNEDTMKNVIAINSLILVFKLVMLNLVKADKMLAKTAMGDAINTTVENPKNQDKVDRHIEKAKKEFKRAHKEENKGHPDKAIEFYKHAWHHAQLAIKHAERTN